MDRDAQTRGVWQQKGAEEGPATADEPLIIQYTNLLHRCRSPHAKEVQAFLRKHKEDQTFIQRAEVLNKVFQLKEQLVMG
jgi:hypothetical protein